MLIVFLLFRNRLDNCNKSWMSVPKFVFNGTVVQSSRQLPTLAKRRETRRKANKEEDALALVEESQGVNEYFSNRCNKEVL